MTTPLAPELADVEILSKIHARAAEVDAARARVTELVDEVSELVVEAVDGGEPYRDIAEAAGRSVGWVQVTMERIGVEGPRVRRRPDRVRTKEKTKVACPDCGEKFLRLDPHQRGGKCKGKKTAKKS